VPACEERRQNFADDLLLADDDAAKLILERRGQAAGVLQAERFCHVQPSYLAAG